VLLLALCASAGTTTQCARKPTLTPEQVRCVIGIGRRELESTYGRPHTVEWIERGLPPRRGPSNDDAQRPEEALCYLYFRGGAVVHLDAKDRVIAVDFPDREHQDGSE
jgi:hypothetical protein